MTSTSTPKASPAPAHWRSDRAPLRLSPLVLRTGLICLMMGGLAACGGDDKAALLA